MRVRTRVAISLVVGGLIVLAIAVALAATAPIDPRAYAPAAAPPLSGVLAPDRALRDAELLGVDLPGPEDVAVDERGRLYCGLEDGTVRRMDPAADTPRFEVFATTGGRPLGLDFDAAGVLWVADARLGLLSIDRRGEVRVRLSEAGGVPVGFADDVAVAGDGKVYVSDASVRFGAGGLLLEVLEARPHGRLLELDPGSGRTRVLLDDLYFANGVAVAPDDAYVLVVETFRYRIRRVWVRGPDAGRDEILVDSLPGFPDGVSGDGRGTFWVALYGLRDPLLDRVVHPRPWIKRLLARLPERLQSKTPPYGLVLAVDSDGRILRSLHDPGGETVSHITSVEPVGDVLYLGTVEGSSLGRYRLR